jgi:hypothetical protein
MLLAALEVEKPVGVELAEIAAGPPLFGRSGLPQIAEQGRALDQHFTVFGQADFHMGQGPPDLRPLPRAIEAPEAHSDSP